MGRSSRRHRTGGVGARKDRTLQARIPEQLDRALRSRADRLGLSVSTVVRNVLLHTFELVDDVVSDSAEIARALVSGNRGRETGSASSLPPEDRPEPVMGWQEIVLNRNAVCEHCNGLLPKGTRAGLGVPVSLRPVFLCRSCMTALATPGDEEQRNAPTARGAGPRRMP